MKIPSFLLIFFGILWCLIGSYYFWLSNKPDRLSFQNYKPIETIQINKDSKQIMPIRVVINDLKIDLPLIPAKVDNDKWETTHSGASYLASSPIPGETGNSIIYGHNWASLLGNLTQARPGQAVEIVFSDGLRKRFVIEYTSIVSPTASNVLATSKNSRITLYTCTGFLDSKRFVAVALLDKNPSFDYINRD